jgi:hypothetical protein
MHFEMKIMKPDVKKYLAKYMRAKNNVFQKRQAIESGESLRRGRGKAPRHDVR